MKKIFERSTSQLTVIGRSLLVLTSIIVLSFPLLVIYGSHGSTLLREIRSLNRIIDRTVLS